MKVWKSQLVDAPSPVADYIRLCFVRGNSQWLTLVDIWEWAGGDGDPVMDAAVKRLIDEHGDFVIYREDFV